MPRKEKMNGECCGGKHMKWMGGKMLVLGLLILANAYLIVVDWSVFIGIIVALAGLFKLIMPMHK
ncbi:MAG: hypothetical protein Q7R52_03770 [archaeon]|nr:hypothetical protein [archaeon]